MQGLTRAPAWRYTHLILPLKRETTKEKAEYFYQPINFLQRYSKATLVNPLVNISPNCYTSQILQILNPLFTNFLTKPYVISSIILVLRCGLCWQGLFHYQSTIILLMNIYINCCLSYGKSY